MVNDKKIKGYYIMFMFKKKVAKISTSTALQKEAKKFQNAVNEINKNYKSDQIDIALIEGISSKFGVDSSFVASSFETYLKKNALSAIKKIKASDNYTMLNLEQTAENYGFTLDDLDITYFSKE